MPLSVAGNHGAEKRRSLTGEASYDKENDFNPKAKRQSFGLRHSSRQISNPLTSISAQSDSPPYTPPVVQSSRPSAPSPVRVPSRAPPQLHARRSLLGLRQEGSGGLRSLLSSNSLFKIAHGDDAPTVISQPTPVDSSREKLRNKLRHSTSLLSVHVEGMPELNTTYEERQRDTLLKLCSPSVVLNSLPAPMSRYCKVINLDQSPVSFVLQEISINKMLSDNPGFAPISRVAMTGDKVLLEYGASGVPLLDFWPTAAEAVEIFRATAKILSGAERSVQFEHRDLQLSRIVVQQHPLRVTLVDCALSRVSCPLYTPLDHPGFFKVEGCEVYRAMQRLLSPNWEQFNPETNVLWLRYLAQQLTAKLDINQVSKMRAINRVLKSRRFRSGPRSATDVVDSLAKLK